MHSTTFRAQHLKRKNLHVHATLKHANDATLLNTATKNAKPNIGKKEGTNKNNYVQSE